MFCSSCGANIPDGTVFCPSCGSRQPGAAPQPPQAQAPASQPPQAQTPWAAAPPAYPAAFAAGYASWGTRAIGFIIDGFLVGAAMGIIYFVAAGVLTSMAGLANRGAAGGMCCMFIILFPLATLVVGIYNSVYLVAQRGYSIGQGVVNVKVVDASGNLLTQGTAFIRLLVRAAMGMVPFLPLVDLLWPLWDERGQTLHDKAVNCYVVNNPRV